MWWGGLNKFCLLSYLLFFSTYFLLYIFLNILKKSTINKWDTELLGYACIKFSRQITKICYLSFK